MNLGNFFQKKFAVFLLAGICLAVGVFLVWQKPSVKPSAGDKINAVASFYPVYFLVSKIGGERINLDNVIPFGMEPHDYEPTAKQMAFIEKSDLLFVNGGGVEPWTDRLTLSSKTVVTEVGAGLFSRKFNDGNLMRLDPHIWLSPILMQKMAETVKNELIKADPINAEFYRVSAARLIGDFVALDDEYRKVLSVCANRVIVTSHSAFFYLADAYGLEQVSIAGLSPEEEPSPKQMADIVKLVKNQNITHIFFENLVSPKLAQTIADETGAVTMVLDPLEGISESDISAGVDYFTKMRDNLAQLKTALQCTE
jgi:zinc transport system substrate-binding protein